MDRKTWKQEGSPLPILRQAAATAFHRRGGDDSAPGGDELPPGDFVAGGPQAASDPAVQAVGDGDLLPPQVAEGQDAGEVVSRATGGDQLHQQGDLETGEQAAIDLRINGTEHQPADGESPEELLERAMWQGHADELVDLLSRHPGLPSQPNADGMPPLYLAIYLGHHDIARRLMQRPSPPVATINNLSYDGPNGQSVLHVAVLRSQELTRMVLDHQRDLLNRVDNSGNSPLHFAASVGVEGITELLLEQGATGFAQRDQSQMCPIHIAASLGAMDAVRALARRANCRNVRDGNGGTFLHVAVENKKIEVVKFVCSEPELEGILNLKDNAGNTALHLAVKKRDESIFSHLLGNRLVELNHVNKEGYTPLDLARNIKLEHPYAFIQNPTEWMIRVLAHSGAHFSARKRENKGLFGCYPGPGNSPQASHSALGHQNLMHGVTAYPTSGPGSSSQASHSSPDHQNPMHHSQALNQTNSKTREDHELDLARSTDSVLVASALIATVTFAAAFTMPGSYKTDGNPKAGTPALGSHYGFKVFLVADIFAFFCSVAATFCLAEYGNRGSVDPLVRCIYARRAVWFFHVALKSVIVAFALGVSVVMWDVSVATAIIVAVTTSLLVVYGNIALGHDFRLMMVMYRRFGLSLSWALHRSTSSHLDWNTWRLRSFSATLIYNMFKLFWTYILIFVVAYLAQCTQK